MKRRKPDQILEKYPYLNKYLDQKNIRFDINSDGDILELFNIVLKEINDKKKCKKTKILIQNHLQSS